MIIVFKSNVWSPLKRNAGKTRIYLKQGGRARIHENNGRCMVLYFLLLFFFKLWDRNSKSLGSINAWGCKNERNTETI